VRRGLALTAAVAAATLAVIIGASFILQAAVLGRPDHNELVVVGTIAKLVAYRTSQAAITLERRTLTTVCVQRWQQRERIEAVKLGGGATIVELGQKVVPSGARAVGEFELAGCPHSLSKWLTTQLNHGTPLHIVRTRLAGRAVLAVSFARPARQLTVFLPRRGGLPLALRLSIDGLSGVSRLHYGAVAGSPEPAPARARRG